MAKRPQITCSCSAYNFPHRLSGGKCNGTEWCDSFFRLRIDSALCEQCICNRDGVCEVAQGQESITQCEAVEDVLRTGQYGILRLPSDEEQYMTRLRHTYDKYIAELE